MKGPRELRRIINRLRARAARVKGKRNGGVGWIDDPWIEQLEQSPPRQIARRPKPDDAA